MQRLSAFSSHETELRFQTNLLLKGEEREWAKTQRENLYFSISCKLKTKENTLRRKRSVLQKILSKLPSFLFVLRYTQLNELHRYKVWKQSGGYARKSWNTCWTSHNSPTFWSYFVWSSCFTKNLRYSNTREDGSKHIWSVNEKKRLYVICGIWIFSVKTKILSKIFEIFFQMLNAFPWRQVNLYFEYCGKLIIIYHNILTIRLTLHFVHIAYCKEKFLHLIEFEPVTWRNMFPGCKWKSNAVSLVLYQWKTFYKKFKITMISMWYDWCHVYLNVY